VRGHRLPNDLSNELNDGACRDYKVRVDALGRTQCQGWFSEDIQPRKSQNRVQHPACLITISTSDTDSEHKGAVAIAGIAPAVAVAADVVLAATCGCDEV